MIPTIIIGEMFETPSMLRLASKFVIWLINCGFNNCVKISMSKMLLWEEEDDVDADVVSGPRVESAGRRKFIFFLINFLNSFEIKWTIEKKVKIWLITFLFLFLKEKK